MSGAEAWGFPTGAAVRPPAGAPASDATRSSFWSPALTNACPECHHPTDSHRLFEIATNPAGGRVARASGRAIYEVECVVCQRQCCRTYG